MSDFTRKLKRNNVKLCLDCSNYNTKTSQHKYKIQGSGSTRVMAVKQNNNKNYRFMNRKGFSLAMTNQGVRKTCCTQSNTFSHITQHSYYNLLRRKTSCVTCSSKDNKVNVYKRFTDDNQDVITNKKLKLLLDIEKNCPPDNSVIFKECCEAKPTSKKLPYQSASEHIQNVKLRRCKGFGCDANGNNCTKLELPITNRRSCRHI